VAFLPLKVSNRLFLNRDRVLNIFLHANVLAQLMLDRWRFLQDSRSKLTLQVSRSRWESDLPGYHT
jgi:hypothetical protein